ncbi:hypothetical protein [Vulcanisaeta souniana]|uniref:Uncharacterized protein n=1 Tax=Vulcanisaeta souniana JCM 11219 TaxID=1293586 RepID=A0A830E4F3_9CREN|nr:hypothetical protein [Vulcanisaeta souniana]BDR91894.1 hypothetical protein Vsou_09870 [Vulcanisaeta souniana JCM 11219]GGI69529.1 hypothetical protein GCM10007112_03150 [Vulcanisaeta souniana JCM 11219]
MNAVVTEVIVDVVGYNQPGKYYQFPASSSFCLTLPLVSNAVVKIHNVMGIFAGNLIIVETMNSIGNETLNMRLGKLRVSLSYYCERVSVSIRSPSIIIAIVLEIS